MASIEDLDFDNFLEQNIAIWTNPDSFSDGAFRVKDVVFETNNYKSELIKINQKAVLIRSKPGRTIIEGDYKIIRRPHLAFVCKIKEANKLIALSKKYYVHLNFLKKSKVPEVISLTKKVNKKGGTIADIDKFYRESNKNAPFAKGATSCYIMAKTYDADFKQMLIDINDAFVDEE